MSLSAFSVNSAVRKSSVLLRLYWWRTKARERESEEADVTVRF